MGSTECPFSAAQIERDTVQGPDGGTWSAGWGCGQEAGNWMASGSQSRTRESRGGFDDLGAKIFRSKSEPPACKEQLGRVHMCAHTCGTGRIAGICKSWCKGKVGVREAGRPQGTAGRMIPVSRL